MIDSDVDTSRDERVAVADRGMIAGSGILKSALPCGSGRGPRRRDRDNSLPDTGRRDKSANPDAS